MFLSRSVSLVAVLGLLFGLTVAAFAQPVTPNPFICMYGHYDGPGVTDAFRDIIPPFSVIEGTSTDVSFINELRNQGKIYAKHVTNPLGASVGDLYANWSAPFKDTLGGQLPGGYDAIAIDELRNDQNGSVQSDRVCDALELLRLAYPAKKIFAATTYHLGETSYLYSDQLNALNDYADAIMVENYLREGNRSYGRFVSYADSLKATVPGILNKTVFGLYVSQNGFIADDRADVGYWGVLDEQFHRIRNDPDAATMPGIMAWAYYRCETDVTPQYLAKLVDHYYVQNNTTYLGDGSDSQHISNPLFASDTSGWSLAPGSGGVVQRFEYSVEGVRDNRSSDPIRNLGQGPVYVPHGSHGLKMARGSAPNQATYQMSVDTGTAYTVSAFVLAEAGSSNSARVKVTEADGTPIASKQISHVGTYDYSRIIFNFTPTSDTIRIVLEDGPAAPGTTLYWDFIELEDAYPVSQEPPHFSMAIVSVDNSAELTGYETQDLVVDTTSDWLSAQLVVQLQDPGGIYQDAVGNTNPQSPNPAWLSLRPVLAFDTYVGNGVLGESVSTTGAVDLGGPLTAVFDEDAISIAWWTSDHDDIGLLDLARLTLADDATGRWSFMATAAPAEGPMVMAEGYVVNGVLVFELGGDLNGDGFVGQSDLDIVLAVWGDSAPLSDPRADPTGDDFVGQGDLDTVLADWGQGLPPTPTPEPASLSLLGACVVVLIRRRRRTILP